MILFLRRRNLGRGSCRGVKASSKFKDKTIIRRLDQRIPEEVDVLVRWGTTGVGPAAKVTLNRAGAIALCANKAESRKVLSKHNIPVPKLYEEDNVVFPVIVRPEYHSQGRHLYFCKNNNELGYALTKIRQGLNRNFYISKYIKKEREYGVFVFDGKVTSVVEKVTENKEAIAWNVAQGNSKFSNLKWNEWPLEACDAAVKSVKALGLDFARVDVIEDSNGRVYVLELNSAHSMTSDYRKQCFAKALDYFILHGRVPKSNFEKYKTYKFFIHPAIKIYSDD